MTSQAETRVTIGDRRKLPFFQVRLDAVRAIRRQAGGPRRLRAIGFYALLCQLANEQRHAGEHRVVQVQLRPLADRGQASKSTIKLLLDTLARAGVVRYERLNEPDRGATVSLIHLLVQDGAWAAITVAMADHLARERDGAHLLRDLGLIVVYLELCGEQRTGRGGLSAEATRSEIAARAGLTVDRIDDRNRVLERAGVLRVQRRRTANKGRNLPSTYTLHEAPPPEGGELVPAGPQNSNGRAAGEYCQGRQPVPAGPQNSTGRTAGEYCQGRELVPAGPQNSNGRAEHGYWQGGNSATLGTASRPSNARAGEPDVEKAVETPPPIATQRTSGEGGRGLAKQRAASCAKRCLRRGSRRSATAHAAPTGPTRRRWLAAAGELLGRHPRARLQHALDYMVCDEILGSKALTLPDFANVADQLLARHHARQRRASTPQSSR